ncbi:MAG: methyltransferase domain-containing protein [Desulfobacterota bacterium]|nr:methyltransferase domain-containing protein [Thermodesulfobacteriota bacterium]
MSDKKNIPVLFDQGNDHMKPSLLARINYSSVYAYELLDTIVHFPDLLLKRFYKIRVPSDNSLVLELGCGTGRSSRMFAGKNVRVVNADINKTFVAYGNKKKRLDRPVVCSAYALGFCTNAFDVVIVPDAFHHILNHEQLFCECNRVLKREGIFIIFDIVMEKKAPNAVINHFADGFIWSLSVQGFLEKIKNLAAAFGFTVAEVTMNKEKTLMGLLGGIDIQVRMVKNT